MSGRAEGCLIQGGAGGLDGTSAPRPSRDQKSGVSETLTARTMPAVAHSGRTRDLTLLHLRSLRDGGLHGNGLLLEALLRRGFLVLGEDGALWVPRGPHSADLLRLRPWFDQERVSDSRRQARLRLRRRDVWDVVTAVVSIPQHQPGTWMRVNWPDGSLWRDYQRSNHSHVVSVGPTRYHGGLDIGVGLLVKALPLIRVRAVQSCDGHGVRPAGISFWSAFDATWCGAVLDTLDVPMPCTTTTWHIGDGRAQVCFAPDGGFDDAPVLGLLQDLQRLGRRLIDSELASVVGAARRRTLRRFDREPAIARFADAAVSELRQDPGRASSETAASWPCI